MNPRDLRSYAFAGQLRIYNDYVLSGYEAVVTMADDQHVMVLTHDLVRTYELNLSWGEFTRRFTLRADTTAEKQALLLRNTLRNIATKADKSVAVILERYLDEPPTLTEVTVKAPKNAPQNVIIRADYHRHTCIELRRENGVVTYVPLGDGTIDVHTTGAEKFDAEFMHVMDDYPPEKAAQLYVQFALHLGATPEALTELGRLTTISKKEYDMATAKPVTEGTKKPAPAVKNAPPAAKKATTAAEKPAKAAPAVKTAPEAKEKAAPAAKTAPAKKTAPAAKKDSAKAPARREPGERKPSAASRFQDLIMEGKLTDDEIFATVKKEFSLSDDKRSYVAWYRNYLIKKGKTPPAMKEAKKAA